MTNLDITCPESNLPERIGCLVDRTGEIVAVLRCSRFSPPREVRCAQACRALTAGGATCSCHVPTVEDPDELAHGGARPFGGWPSPNG